MTDEEFEIKAAIVKSNNPMQRLCKFCCEERYCRSYCKTQEDASRCKHRLVCRQNSKRPAIPVNCPHCNKGFESGSELRGHLVACDKNPRAEDRNKKVAESKLGKPRPKHVIKKLKRGYKAYLRKKKLDAKLKRKEERAKRKLLKQNKHIIIDDIHTDDGNDSFTIIVN